MACSGRDEAAAIEQLDDGLWVLLWMLWANGFQNIAQLMAITDNAVLYVCKSVLMLFMGFLCCSTDIKIFFVVAVLIKLKVYSCFSTSKA